MFEILATIFGLIQGALIMFNKRSNWIFYVLQMITLVAFSWQASLYGDVATDLVYIVLGVVSYFAWSSTDLAKISVYSLKQNALWLVGTVVSIGIAYMLIKNTDDPLPLLDSTTAVLSIVATIMMASHKIESWIVWLIDDILYCIQYFMLPDQALWLFGLNLIWSFMAIGSLINWIKIYKEDQNEN